ncbi:hypothetical protein Poli38472_012360 [Pythium oligandrum]|uniref:Uncharacterized protein n=1 Tax=Pythium oligandrum TaxID=41045 RepID=A0A8K1FNE7_PYTOL|nr:hypothetical protein Poli38472_012360 [Pythium oligandrum]|eukprot:TMW67244.1 hypothetical protein Poli38472_012360 [Pythium oligandrum]
MADLSALFSLDAQSISAQTLAMYSPGADVTDAGRSSSESEGERVRRVPRKKPKTTYYARKDEIVELQEQIKALATQLNELKATQPVETQAMDASVQQNGVIRRGMLETDLVLARVQSELSNHAAKLPQNPLRTFIHLVADPEARQHTLQALWKPMIDDAMRFMAKRAALLDHRRAYQQSEVFRGDDGLHVCVQNDVTPFKGLTSVKDVFDDFLLTSSQYDFTMAEHLGITAVRQADDDGDPLAYSYRFFATTPEGIDLEKNTALFRAFLPDGSEHLAGPHGIIVMDAVDVDDLHPHASLDRVRNEYSSAVLVYSSPPLRPGDEPIVSIVRWSFARLHLPRNGMSSQKEERLLELIPRMSDITRRVVRQYVSRRGQSTPCL